jgi:ABC-type multidrug transport system fused ATPase/permease subunit
MSTRRHFRAEWGAIAKLALVSLLGAQFEAASLVLLVPLAKLIAAGESSYRGKLGPFTLDVGVNELALLVAVSVVFAALASVFVAWRGARIAAAWELRQRRLLVQGYLAADYPTQTAERQGKLETLSTYADAGRRVLGAITYGIRAGLNLAVFVTAAVVLDYRTAFAIFVMGFILFSVLRPLSARIRRYNTSLAAVQVAYNQHLSETSRLAREIRVYSAASTAADRLDTLGARIARLKQRSMFLSVASAPAYQYAGLLLIVFILVGARALGSVEIGALGAIALLLLRSVSFGQQVQIAHQTVNEYGPYVDSLEELGAHYGMHTTPDGTIALEAIHTVDLDDLTYSYDGDQPAVDSISVRLRCGEIVGVVGRSGSGKSTLSQLLLRLREPTRGSILVNGTPAEEYTLSSWYRKVSLVPQDSRLLHGSVAENIAFFDATIGRGEVEAAAKAAGVHDVIMSLSQGYETSVGPSFRDLSGGQIQRVGIARALVRDADVVVLDEPTSALDVHSEAVIQATIEGLRGKALVVIIAHRLSTLSICDRIIVLDNGRLESVGSLAEVAERSPYFRRALEVGTLEIGSTEQGSSNVPVDEP